MGAESGQVKVVIDFPASTKALGKVLHAVHLDRIGKAALDAHTLHTEIDGIAQPTGRLTDTQVFSVEPGEHDILLWTTGLRATRTLTEQAARVRVAAGETTVLRYLYKETSAELTTETR